jgi:diadenosine tetraphosphate (Ap4A) HIT family hydrolase
MFLFDPRLIDDCEVLGKFKLCHVLLMRDANYPWVILVPDRANVSEVFDLSEEDQERLSVESNVLSAFIKKEFKADKMNVAALGNVVSQLHIHHIVRYTNDIAWPKPVWGAFSSKAYTSDEIEKLTARLSKGFEMLDLDFQAK